MGKAAQKQAPTFVSIKKCGSQWVAANKVAFQLGYKRPHGAVCNHVTPCNQATLRSLRSNGIKDGIDITANQGILNCSVATQSTSTSSYCKASLHPLCITAVKYGACIPHAARHRLLYSASLIGTLGTSVGSSMLRLVLCCLRS